MCLPWTLLISKRANWSELATLVVGAVRLYGRALIGSWLPLFLTRGPSVER